MDLLHWQNLIFLIPLAIGLIFAIGTAIGMGGDGDHDHDLDADHDLAVDADVDLDHDHDFGGDHGHDLEKDHDHGAAKANVLDLTRQRKYRDPVWLKALGVLGVGKAPLTVVLTVLNLCFGGFGIAGNLTLGRGWFWLSLTLAALGAIVLGGRISAAVGKVVPKTESQCATRRDLVGKYGTILLKTDDEFGQAHVTDQYGNLHRVLCKAEKGQIISVGNKVVVVAYDESSNSYQVVETDIEPPA